MNEKIRSRSASNEVKKILITGSSGTIGTRLFEKLLQKEYEVVGFDKKENKWHEHINKLTVIGNLLNKNALKKLPVDFDLIIHLAANPGVHDLVKNPHLAMENTNMTFNVLSFAKENNISKFIFSSSREVYGDRKEIFAKENDVNIELCESPYAAGKFSDEAFIISFWKCYGIDYIICRFSNVYGMYDESDRFIPLLIKKMKNNEGVQIFGKDKVLDFIHIDDCVDGVIACVEKFNGAKNNAFNIAYGKGEKLVNIARIMKNNLKSKSDISIGENRQGEVVKFTANISKARKVLGYNPKTNIKKGLELAINWYKNH